jgi:mannosyltransferase OCH1-like enzyme
MLIHTTWKNDTVPEHWESTLPAWKRLHPTADIKLWTDAQIRELIASEHAEYLEVFDSLPHNIQRVDMGRTMILFKFGGIYADLDVQPLVSIDSLYQLFLDSNCDIAFAETPNSMGKYFYSNYLMFARPQASFWPIYWESIRLEKWRQAPWVLRTLKKMTLHFEVMLTTGPTAISLCISRLPLEEKQKIWLISNTYVGQNQNAGKEVSSRHVWHMFRHLPGESWVDKSTSVLKLCSKIVNNWKDVLIILLLLLWIISVVVLVVTRPKKK